MKIIMNFIIFFLYISIITFIIGSYLFFFYLNDNIFNINKFKEDEFIVTRYESINNDEGGGHRFFVWVKNDSTTKILNLTNDEKTLFLRELNEIYNIKNKSKIRIAFIPNKSSNFHYIPKNKSMAQVLEERKIKNINQITFLVLPIFIFLPIFLKLKKKKINST